MDWNAFFTPEAIATYVTALLALIFGVIGFFASRWITRKKIKKIFFIKYSESEVLKVDPNVKRQIQVTYKDKPVDSLYQTTFDIRNYSEEVIDDIYLRVHFEDPNIIDINEIRTGLFGQFSISQAPEDDALEITISYLNQYKLYKNYLRISVIALKPVKVLGVEGGGREWNVEYYDFEKSYKEAFEDLATISLNPAGFFMIAIKKLPSFIKIIQMRN